LEYVAIVTSILLSSDILHELTDDKKKRPDWDAVTRFDDVCRPRDFGLELL
jgi:hypothetical protein